MKSLNHYTESTFPPSSGNDTGLVLQSGLAINNPRYVNGTLNNYKEEEIFQ